MKLGKLLAVGYLLLVSLGGIAPVAAQSLPLAPVEPLPVAHPVNLHIPLSAARSLPLAEWDVLGTGEGYRIGDTVAIVEGADAVARAPEGASIYTATDYKYPSGSIRILRWEAGSGPVIKQVTFETQLLVLQGAVEVGVGDEIVALGEGDAAFLPSGTIRNQNPAGDTVILQYFVGHTAENPAAQVVRRSDLQWRRMAEWLDEDGNRQTTTQSDGIEAAPQGAGIFSVARYPFDGNSIRHAKLEAGGVTTPVTYRVDVLIYLSKGRMRRVEGDQEFIMTAGDAVREAQGATGYWEILEDSEFIATNAPFEPARTRRNR
jgi:mannose-6-phosphate isomerase-like protein (cupin superfamily)